MSLIFPPSYGGRRQWHAGHVVAQWVSAAGLSVYSIDPYLKLLWPNFSILYVSYKFLKASGLPFDLNTKLVDNRIDGRVNDELLHLNRESLISFIVMSKSAYQL